MHAHLYKNRAGRIYCRNDDEAMQAVWNYSKLEGIYTAIESSQCLLPFLETRKFKQKMWWLFTYLSW